MNAVLLLSADGTRAFATALCAWNCRLMPTFTRGQTSIYYEVHGSGYPVLLFAPGGMRSSIPLWERSPFHPIRELESEFRVIAMDQRNAGQSRAPIAASDGWHTYTADHIALLDELAVDRCHVLGQCIGGAFCLSLMATAPERVTAGVLEQPIGLGANNRGLFQELIDTWGEELLQTRTDVTREAIAGVGSNFYSGDFAFSVSREQVKACSVPLLVLRGADPYHPSEISEEIARLAPRAALIPSWREGDDLARALVRVREFLRAYARNAAPLAR
jgi:pimeloyl-ACP methyl ester carboxylesterase